MSILWSESIRCASYSRLYNHYHKSVSSLKCKQYIGILYALNVMIPPDVISAGMGEACKNPGEAVQI